MCPQSGVRAGREKTHRRGNELVVVVVVVVECYCILRIIIVECPDALDGRFV